MAQLILCKVPKDLQQSQLTPTAGSMSPPELVDMPSTIISVPTTTSLMAWLTDRWIGNDGRVIMLQLTPQGNGVSDSSQKTPNMQRNG